MHARTATQSHTCPDTIFYFPKDTIDVIEKEKNTWSDRAADTHTHQGANGAGREAVNFKNGRSNDAHL